MGKNSFSFSNDQINMWTFLVSKESYFTEVTEVLHHSLRSDGSLLYKFYSGSYIISVEGSHLKVKKEGSYFIEMKCINDFFRLHLRKRPIIRISILEVFQTNDQCRISLPQVGCTFIRPKLSLRPK